MAQVFIALSASCRSYNSQSPSTINGPITTAVRGPSDPRFASVLTWPSSDFAVVKCAASVTSPSWCARSPWLRMTANRLVRTPIIFFLLLNSNVYNCSATDHFAPCVGSAAVEFDVTLKPKTKAKFRVRIEPSWAPLGAARFREIVDANILKSARFFRTIKGFMTQFGIPGKPAAAAEWREKKIQDDPVKESNKRGYITFATSGKDSRTTQMFINLADNTNLDVCIACAFDSSCSPCNPRPHPTIAVFVSSLALAATALATLAQGMGFSPFGKVVGSGMDDVVSKIFDGYGEGAPSGNGPNQGTIQSDGNKYLKKNFPKLSYINSVTIVDDDDREL